MEYNNYFIEYKLIDSDLFLKITDKNTKISYENIITQNQINDLPINKFIKILENSIKLIPDYNVDIEIEIDQLILYLSYDNEIINLDYTIYLDKFSSTEINNSLLKRIEQLEKIIDDNNLITIAKIFNIEIQNDKMTKLTTDYIRYSKDTTHIEINLPDDTYDISKNIKNIYQLQFNFNIDPTEIFTNLKKLSVSKIEYLLYFSQFAKYKSNKKGILSSDIEYNVYINNNTIQEITISDKKTSALNLICNSNIDVNEILKYNKFNINATNINGGKNHVDMNRYFIDYPELTIIKIDCIDAYTINNFLNNFIKKCKKLKTIIIYKFIIYKIVFNIDNINHNCLPEIREYCENNNIKLEIVEIIIK